jgi:hypothetical protein
MGHAYHTTVQYCISKTNSVFNVSGHGQFNYLKGTVSREFRPSVFFHQTIPPWDLIHELKPFRIGLRTCRENQNNRLQS